MIKKKIQIVQETSYEVSGVDVNIIRNCLNYCFHRAYKHGKSIAGDVDQLQRLRKEFEIL